VGAPGVSVGVPRGSARQPRGRNGRHGPAGRHDDDDRAAGERQRKHHDTARWRGDSAGAGCSSGCLRCFGWMASTGTGVALRRFRACRRLPDRAARRGWEVGQQPGRRLSTASPSHVVRATLCGPTGDGAGYFEWGRAWAGARGPVTCRHPRHLTDQSPRKVATATFDRSAAERAEPDSLGSGPYPHLPRRRARRSAPGGRRMMGSAAVMMPSRPRRTICSREDARFTAASRTGAARAFGRRGAGADQVEDSAGLDSKPG